MDVWYYLNELKWVGEVQILVFSSISGEKNCPKEKLPYTELRKKYLCASTHTINEWPKNPLQ